MERKGLGRGLSALMADVSLEEISGTAARAEMKLPIEQLRPNPHQPRTDFDEMALRALADSIRQKGLIQPLIVRPAGDHYQIVAGERRWRAAQMAQLHDVPVIIRALDDQAVLEIAIIENVQREDLNAIEEALGLRALIDRFGHTQEMVAEALSRSRSHVANLLRLLALPQEVQDMVREGALSAGHARALIGTDDSLTLAKRVVQDGLSVRQTERLVRRLREEAGREAPAVRKQADAKDADTRALEADLAANLGLPVSIDDHGGAGNLVIRYRNLDELDRICGVLTRAGDSA